MEYNPDYTPKYLENDEYDPTKEDLIKELAFMYSEYQSVCEAYKKLHHSIGSLEAKTVHDMSHMNFIEKENKGEK